MSEDHPRTIAEAAAEIGIGYHKLRKLVAGNACSFKRIGRTVRFYNDDIAATKEQFQVTPRPAPVVSIGRRGRAA
jgi:excisionase family DNA binding protein